MKVLNGAIAIPCALLAAGFAIFFAAQPALSHRDKDRPQRQTSQVGGFGGPFSLINELGQVVSDKDFRGKLMVVYFGYTHCPDICPLDAASIGAAMDLLGAAAKRVQPLFISIDPERDTPQRLKEWLGAIHPSFVGLTGMRSAVAAAARAYRVVYERVETASSHDVTFNHPGLIYIMGLDGSFLFLLPAGTPPEIISEELRAVLAKAK